MIKSAIVEEMGVMVCDAYISLFSDSNPHPTFKVGHRCI
jgi:hypothetical protein